MFCLDLQERYDLLDKQVILCQFKVKLDTGVFRSISHVQSFNLLDKQEVLESFMIYFELKSDEYASIPLNKVVFTYKILDKNNDIRMKIHKSAIDTISSEIPKNVYRTGDYSLLSTMDISQWGTCTFTHYYTRGIVHKKNSNIIYDVSIMDKYTITLVLSSQHGKKKTLLNFKDIMLDHNDLTTFKIIIMDAQEYNFSFFLRSCLNVGANIFILSS